MAQFSQQFLKRTIEVWQPYSPEPLTLDDAQEIADTVIPLYAYLLQLKKKYDAQEKL